MSLEYTNYEEMSDILAALKQRRDKYDHLQGLGSSRMINTKNNYLDDTDISDASNPNQLYDLHDRTEEFTENIEKSFKSNDEDNLLDNNEEVSSQKNLASNKATIKGALDTSVINLLGVFGGEEGKKVLIRFKDGETGMFKVGEELDGGKILSINLKQKQVTYSKNGEKLTLSMPE